MSCEECNRWEQRAKYWEGETEKLQKQIKDNEKEVDRLRPIERRHDELKKSADASYDSWVTNPERSFGTYNEDED